MFCAKCGNQLSENAKFCGKCGHPVKSKKIEVMPDTEFVPVSEDISQVNDPTGHTEVLPEPEFAPISEEIPVKKSEEISQANDDTAFLLESEPESEEDDRTVVLLDPEDLLLDDDRTVVLPRHEFVPRPEPVPADQMPGKLHDMPQNDPSGQFVPNVEDIGGYQQSATQPEQKKSKTTGILITVLVFLVLASLAAGGFFLQKSGKVDFLAMVGLGDKEEKTETDESSETEKDGEDDEDQDDSENGDDQDQTTADESVSNEAASDQAIAADSDASDAVTQDASSGNEIDIASLTTDPKKMDAYEMFYYFHGAFGEPGKSIMDLNTEMCEFSSGENDEVFVNIFTADGSIEYSYAQVAGYNENMVLFEDLSNPSAMIQYTDDNVLEITIGDTKKTFERVDKGLESLFRSVEGSYVISDSAKVDATHPEKLTVYGFSGDFKAVCVEADGENYTFADVLMGQTPDDFYLVGAKKIHTVKKTDKGIKYAGVDYAK